jgi:hypothetical protein
MLNMARHSHSCAVLSYHNPETKMQERVAVVAGGDQEYKCYKTFFFVPEEEAKYT